MTQTTRPVDTLRKRLAELQAQLDSDIAALQERLAKHAPARAPIAKSAPAWTSDAERTRVLAAVRSSVYAAGYVLAKRAGRAVDDVVPVLLDELDGELRKNRGSRDVTFEQALEQAQASAFSKLWTGRT